MLRRTQLDLRDTITGSIPLDNTKDKSIAQIFAMDETKALRRLNLHRYHFIKTMSEVLANTYPVIEQLVGADYFHQEAVQYIHTHPPTSPRLFEYGGAFADFLSHHPTAKTLPYLVDMARLEWMLNCAGNMIDTPSLKPEDLAKYAQDALPELSLPCHPSVSLLTSPYNLLGIWKAHQEDEVPEIDLWTENKKPQNLAVVRPLLKVEIYILDPAILTFLDHCRRGDDLATCAAQAQTTDSSFDLTRSFASLIRQGFFTHRAL